MRCAVLGDPIAHSLSPALHRAAYAALGLDWTYDAHQVPPAGCRRSSAGSTTTWRGLSLTMPLKREALALLRPSADRAARGRRRQHAGARRRRRCTADNTDVPGAVAALRERYDGPLESRHDPRRRRDRGLDRAGARASSGCARRHAAGPLDRPGPPRPSRAIDRHSARARR